jgi:phage recombination protein Bet
MSNDLINVSNSMPTIWEGEENLKQIKQIFAPKLSQLEFTIFVEMGKATNLNPFLRELWAVKYQDNAPAQIFIGRDGYRKSAQNHPLYDYHYVEAIYSNDEFKVINGEISHSYGMVNRGTLLGAYCVVKRRNSSKSTHTIVEFKEYSTGKSLWNTTTGKPVTMIKKVAEAQALKASFQDIFGGTYSEYEQFDNEEITVVDSKPMSKAASKVNELLQQKGLTHDNSQSTQVIEDVFIEQEDCETAAKTTNHHEPEEMGKTRKQENRPSNPVNENPITDELLDEITSLLAEKIIDSDRMEKALRYFEVERIEQMTIDKANRFIQLLNRNTLIRT